MYIYIYMYNIALLFERVFSLDPFNSFVWSLLLQEGPPPAAHAKYPHDWSHRALIVSHDLCDAIEDSNSITRAVRSTDG